MDKIQKQIDELEKMIESGQFIEFSKGFEEWGGADVCIAKEMNNNIEMWLEDRPDVISFQKIIPKKRVVITEYSQELSWLFYQLGDIFHDVLDYVSKYDFYGSLAQIALEYLELNKETNCTKLLLVVIEGSRRFIK